MDVRKRRVVSVLALIALLSGVALATAPQPQAQVPAALASWRVEQQARAGDMKIDRWRGRDALWLRNSTQAVHMGPAFIDGTIEFELLPMAEGDFFALTFRRESLSNHENVYFRLSRSGEFMALQYAPRMNGSSTWQLYPEFTARTDWPRERWTHVRVEVRGSRLEIFVGDAKTPTLSVPRLRHSAEGTQVALWGRVNDKPAEWAAAVAKFKVTPAPAATRVPPAAVGDGYLADWQVAGPVTIDAAADTAGDPTPPADVTWVSVRAEESGLVNLNRRFAIQPNTRRTVFARTVVAAPRAGRARLDLGFSDDVVVWLNGEPLYRGANGWGSRYDQFVSFVDARFESVYLPLRQGDNELLLAVSDDQRFGWGFSARLQSQP